MSIFNEQTFILWDTEYTCWKGCNEHGWDRSRGRFRELIQIALLKLVAKNFTVVDKLEIFVKPKLNFQLSEYCKKLTNIKQESIDNAEPFSIVLKKLKIFIKDYNVYAFGKDYEVLKENLKINKLKNPFKNKFYNLKPFFIEKGINIEGYTSGTMCEYFNKTSKYHTHDALGDVLSLVVALKELKKL